jgi:hypothetical protein
MVRTEASVPPFARLTAAILVCGAVAWIASRGSEDGAAILLFTGTGTSRGDVAALERVLRSHRFSYTTADSSRLNAMSESQLRAHRLLVVPGGNFVEMGKALAPATAVRIRHAVSGGLNYLGICAGAFLAGNSPYNGLRNWSKTFAADERG